jgi:hypothetical protein
MEKMRRMLRPIDADSPSRIRRDRTPRSGLVRAHGNCWATVTALLSLSTATVYVASDVNRGQDVAERGHDVGMVGIHRRFLYESLLSSSVADTPDSSFVTLLNI